MKHMRVIFAILTLLAILLMSSDPASAQILKDKPNKSHLTPIVLFPGWGGTRLLVTVHNQTVAPECPRSGTFEYTFFPLPSPDFNQTCQDKLLTLVYQFDKNGAMQRVSEQPGVRVIVEDYGKTASSPLYEPLYAFLEQAGYTRDVNIRVAGYDFRLTPDLGGFMERTTELIEETYRENDNTPVHLVGHSNGPLYMQYLLTHTSKQWKDKYIQGVTPIAGNWPGQGWLYQILFTGFNIQTGSYPMDLAGAASSVAMYESHPSTYMSASDPAYFGDQEVVIQVENGKAYTPKDAYQLFADAGLTLAQKIAPYYFGIVKFQPPYYPYVDTYAEKGSGLDTIVGLQLPNIKAPQVISDTPVFIFLEGDSNQEYITNDAINVWQSMPCYHFELNDNPGVDHMSLALATPAIWERLLAHAQQQRSECRIK